MTKTEKTCHPNAFRTQDESHFVHTTYTLKMAPGITFEDLFSPSFWVHARSQDRLRPLDLIRCVGHRNEYDVVLTVASIPAGGVVMKFLYGDPGTHVDDPLKAAAEARKLAEVIRVVPMNAKGEPKVKVQYLPATGWRYTGIDGKEVERGFSDQDTAERAMAAYLQEIHMRLPTEEEAAAHAAAEAEKLNTKVPA